MIKKIAAAALLATATAFTAGSALADQPSHNGAAGVQLVQQDRGRDWDRPRWDRDEGDYRPGRHWDRLSGRDIRHILRQAGFREIRIVDENRRTYTVRAENWRGRDHILTVSAYNGRILDQRPLYRR